MEMTKFIHDSCSDVDCRTQRHLHFDWATNESMLDYIDPNSDNVIPLYPGDDTV